ncbi:TolC family protein [Salinimicrobium sp. HB62]|uniref:TolC family protein n=1 Tax=Salinimicrobium sp. HB62 TaxID=3077781 RepID=UPI002D79CB28|nr:TolC family protein [Salinimicrobium sp. HB62]
MLAQESPQQVLGFTEYLAYVKQYHPVARQANLQLEMGEAELLRARGAFDPKLEVDYARKEFKGTEYYDILNSTFKIPTWYGIELKAGFDQTEGVYLNPERTVPPEGLFSAGVSLSAAQGLIIDKRRAVLRSARALMDEAAAERDLLISEVLYEAAVAYLQWAQLHREMEVYNEFVINARQRYQGISRSAAAGEIPAIDTVEAGITLQDRRLELEQTRVKLLKQRLEVSNFLWLENKVPVELQPEIFPEDILDGTEIFHEEIEDWLDGFVLNEHPKLQALQAKLQALRIERRLKINNLLPKVDLEYNFLTPEPELVDNFDTSNYKAGVKFSFPLFLRKERGELKLAKYKLEDASLELELSRRQIDNKVEALLQELESYVDQVNITEEMVENYQRLLQAEERKFSFGESSLFLINTRENKLIEAQLKQNQILVKYLVAKAELFRSLGIIPVNLD